ncbi:MAG TPA: hypothetical protein VJT33_10425 [bacterium]|nr:hypothetical protein [bacterium]
MQTIVDALVRLILLGHKVLVHRHMGKSRSGLVDALVAMKILGINGREAVELVRRRRPGALGNAVFVQYLESLPRPARAALPAPMP